MCTNLKEMFMSGKYKESNYRGKKGEEYAFNVMVKCGRCEECRNEKSNNWVIRNYYESQEHEKACFITLTYKENPFFLIRKDIQDFIKRFRKAIGKANKKCRIFYAGEYGMRYKRPHKHAIIYGWEEDRKKLTYLDINEKGNVLFKSETVENAWGFGRTTYQEFDKHEIPYITLYESAYEQEKYEYFLSYETAKKMYNDYMNGKKLFADKKRKLQYLNELTKAINDMEKNKKAWKSFKEYNGWSIALGWNAFVKNFIKYNIYDFREYIEDKEFITPTPWVKKLANYGHEQAIKEMLRRAELISNLSGEEQNNINKVKNAQKHSKKVIEFIRKKENTIM